VLYGLATLVYASFGTVFQALPPFFDTLEHEFAVGQSLAGLSMTVFLAPLALTSVVLGAAVEPFIIASFLIFSAGAFLAQGAAAAGPALVVPVVSVMGLGCAMFFPVTLAIPQALVPETLLGAA
jgi:hypothetical protein